MPQDTSSPQDDPKATATQHHLPISNGSAVQPEKLDGNLKTNHDVLRETVEEHLRKFSRKGEAVAAKKEADAFIERYLCAPNATAPSYWAEHAEPEPAPETQPLSDSVVEELAQRFVKSYEHPLSAAGIEVAAAAQGTAQ